MEQQKTEKSHGNLWKALRILGKGVGIGVGIAMAIDDAGGDISDGLQGYAVDSAFDKAEDYSTKKANAYNRKRAKSIGPQFAAMQQGYIDWPEPQVKAKDDLDLHMEQQKQAKKMTQQRRSFDMDMGM